MADLKAILDDLREEVILAVIGIDPQDYKGKKWKAFEKEDSKGNLITDTPGKMRLFQVGRWRFTPMTIGHTQRRYDVNAFITIGYPQGDDYRVTAHADADDIARYLDNNATAVAGCDFRIIRTDEPFLVEYDEEAQWNWLLLPLYAVVETT
jgi:hypothetical protein